MITMHMSVNTFALLSSLPRPSPKEHAQPYLRSPVALVFEEQPRFILGQHLEIGAAITRGCLHR